MSRIVVLAFVVLGACGPSAGRLKSSRTLPLRLERARTPERVDPTSGTVEVQLRCVEPRVEVWCTPNARCTLRRPETVVACPPTPVTLRTGDGLSATATPTESGRVTFAADTLAPPGDTLRVEAGGAELPWAPLEPIPAPVRRDRYTLPIVGVDAALVLTAYPVIALSEQPALGILYAAGYVAGAPIVHAMHDNPRQTWRSVIRRLGYPLVLGLAFALVGSAVETDCYDTCGLIPALAFAAGAGLGGLAAMIEDALRAHVDVRLR
jgi:hypothetical protein